MNSISRSFQRQLVARLEEDAPRIQVLVGPRQVGKTTAIKQIFSDKGLYFSADSPVPLGAQEIELQWNNALKLPEPLLAIDEIQKIRGWSEAIKKLWDGKSRPVKLILLGSAALAIEKDLKESLAGRYELIRVEHWNFGEARDAFGMTVPQFLEFGCYPGSMPMLGDRDRWGAYIRDSIVEPAIGRDILQLHPVDNPSLLRQVFSISAGHPAQIVSLNKLRGMLQDRGALATLQTYLELLGFGFLVSGLQKFSANAIRTRSSPPKLIVHDNALIRAFERPIASAPGEDRLGFYLENAVGARFLEAGWDTFYWKDRIHEVDFVVLGPRGEKWAIEVKASSRKARELKGLEAFCRRNPEFTPCVVCLEPVAIPGVKFLAAEEVLSLSRQAWALRTGWVIPVASAKSFWLKPRSSR
jgi:predicted AAA+ superfamily ATPase